MSQGTLIAILSLACPVLTLIVPTITSYINNIFLIKSENDKFFNGIKHKALDNFINSINVYLVNPSPVNKNKCFLAITELYCYFDIPKDFYYKHIFVANQVNFTEVNELIQAIKNPKKQKLLNLSKNK